MTTPILHDKDSWNVALRYIWSQYRVWAKTSRSYKNEVTRWRDVVLGLSIGGAILGTLSQQLEVWKLTGRAPWMGPMLGFLSGTALGLAAYFTRQALSPDPEDRAVRARSAAEAFKSEAYLLAVGAPPYDAATTADELLIRTEKVKKAIENLASTTITPEQKLAGLPSAPMSVEDYINLRVNQQINQYYLPEVEANTKKIAGGRKLSLALGALAVLLGLLSARFASVAGWIAVIGTITAAIAARQYAGRYQFLVVSYQATVERLESLKTRWEIERKSQVGTEPQNRFILACEEAISIENSAWMAEWTKKPDAANS
jgi:hypothetical protein